MCYDISYNVSLESVADYFPDLILDPQLPLNFDSSIHVLAQSYRKYPIILQEDGNYKLKLFEWGVIADYMNTPEKIKKGRQWMCNAQSEKIVGDRKSYWHRIRGKRCLIPVTGTFEHREVKGIKNKIPYFVKVKGRELFCIPGLYHYAPIPDVETGEVRGTFTLLTRAANSVMKQIHNGGTNAGRMPLFMPSQEMEQRWINKDLSDAEIEDMVNYELPSSELEYWPVYTIRSPKERPDNKTKVDPWEWENLPALGNVDELPDSAG